MRSERCKETLRIGLVCLFLVVGTGLLYAPVRHFGFVTLDDPLYLDDHINRGFSWESLRWCFTTTFGALWHPLTWVSHMLDFEFFGADLGWHHATNVLLHISSSVLLFLLLLRLTGAFWRSTMVAALFAWHPLHVESVAWISERKDVLSALFWMLTLWAYIRYAEESKVQRTKPDPHNARKRIFYVLALVFFALGLMAKPMLVTLPFVFLLLDWWPLRRFDVYSAKLRQAPQAGQGSKMLQPKKVSKMGQDTRPAAKWLLVEKVPFLLFSVLFSILTMAAARHLAVSLADFTLSQRLDISVINYFNYVAKIIWPGNMVVLYPFEYHWAALPIVSACLFVVAVSLTAILLRKSRPYFLFGWLWYLGVLVPVIGLVQVGAQPMADRYTYIPSIGLFILFSWGAWDLLSDWRHGKLALGVIAAGVLLACVLVTGRQLQYWRNSEALFTHNLELTPDNYIARANYAAYFYDEKEPARAIEESRKSLHLRPDYALGHSVLGNALVMQGKFQDAITELVIALQLEPSSEVARLGYAKALLGQGRAVESAQQISTELEADPDNPEAHCVLGKALLAQGNLTGASNQFTEAMSLVNKYPDAQFQLAVVLARQGKITEAMENYREAKNVPASVPDYDVLNNLAWILAASPLPENRDGAKAVELATRARDLDHSQQPVIIGTLAAAYAEAGRFDEAAATAQQAHDLALKAAGEAPNAADQKAAKELAARNLELLEIYRSHKAYHETLDFKP